MTPTARFDQASARRYRFPPLIRTGLFGSMPTSQVVVLGVGGFRVAAGAITIASLISFIMFLFLLVMPLATTFFSKAFGMVADRFGVPWMVVAPA